MLLWIKYNWNIEIDGKTFKRLFERVLRAFNHESRSADFKDWNL